MSEVDRQVLEAMLGRANGVRTLSEIAEEIRADWEPVHFSALPYLDAMDTLLTINDTMGTRQMECWYGVESARSIVMYFLCNAGSWKGDVARRIKKELKGMAGLK